MAVCMCRYKWVLQNGVSPCFSADDSSGRVQNEFMEDVDLFSWNLTAAEMNTLSGLTTPSGVGASCYRNAGGGH
jgi:hypothetical protein|eukprot:COSAG01_NODE_1529_length_10001_cov_2.242583_12_plen_74_part_00